MVHEDGTSRTAEEIRKFYSGRPDDGGRVTLRPLTRDDQKEYVGLVRASAELHHPWMPLPSAPDAFDAFVARFDGEASQSLLVCLKDTGAIAGMVNINSIIRGRFQSASLGYAAFAPAAGQGYMTEGLRLVIRYAFEQLRLHRVEADIQPGNHASLALARRVGFRNEGYSPRMLFIDGEWRDHERWAITCEMVDSVSWVPHSSLPTDPSPGSEPSR